MTGIPQALIDRIDALNREIDTNEIKIHAARVRLQELAEEGQLLENSIAPLQIEIEATQAELRILNIANEAWLAKAQQQPVARGATNAERVLILLKQEGRPLKSREIRKALDINSGEIAHLKSKGKILHDKAAQTYTLPG